MDDVVATAVTICTAIMGNIGATSSEIESMEITTISKLDCRCSAFLECEAIVLRYVATIVSKQHVARFLVP